MIERNCLILTQYKDKSVYKDLIGKYYHFPATKKKNYLNQFRRIPIEFVYFEPQKWGSGTFFGHGKIEKPPFQDKNQPDHYFVEIINYESFIIPVHFKDYKGDVLEKVFNSKHYNAQNAVRKINSAFFDKLCFDGGVSFDFESAFALLQGSMDQSIELNLNIEQEFSEGGISMRLHKFIERDSNLPKIKKKKVLRETGKLECEVCFFNFQEVYGTVGEGYAECHHKVPLSTVKETKTTLSDLAIVCANCHRMIHRNPKLLSIEELKNIITLTKR